MKTQIKYGLFALGVICCLGASYQFTGQSNPTNDKRSEQPTTSDTKIIQKQQLSHWNNIPVR